MTQTLILDPTYACNYRCKTCLCPDIHRSAGLGTFPFHRASRILSEFANGGGLEVLLFGGEPLLRLETFRLLSEANGLGLRTAITTNGSLLTSERANALLATGVNKVHISLDGGVHGHEAVRGPGSFERTRTGATNLIRVAVKQGGVLPSINLHCTVSRLNSSNFSEVVNVAAELGHGTTASLSYMSLLRKEELAEMEVILGQKAQSHKSHWRLHENLLLSEDDIGALKREITRSKELAQQFGISVEIDRALGDHFSSEAVLQCKFNLTKPCKVFEQTTIVGPGGELGSCPMLTEFSFGTIEETEPAKWFSDRSRFSDLADRMRAGFLPVCSRCCNHSELM